MMMRENVKDIPTHTHHTAAGMMDIRGEVRSGTYLHVVHTARPDCESNMKVRWGDDGQTDNMGKLQWCGWYSSIVTYMYLT